MTATESVALAISPWHEFLIAAAGAGAVLLGLVFVGLTIHLEGREEQPILVPMAIASATTFFYPVVISLLLLMPPVQPWLPSLALVVLALFATLSSGAPIFDRDLRSTWIARHRMRDFLRFGVPLVAAVLLIGAASLLLVDPVLAMYAIGMVIVVFLVVGTQNAWNLLLAGRFEVGAWSVSRTDRETDTGHRTRARRRA
ncbi:MAG TPA: hypothetical protein VH371_05430 [Candidatus Limnocylindrales bacterium]